MIKFKSFSLRDNYNTVHTYTHSCPCKVHLYSTLLSPYESNNYLLSLLNTICYGLHISLKGKAEYLIIMVNLDLSFPFSPVLLKGISVPERCSPDGTHTHCTSIFEASSLVLWLSVSLQHQGEILYCS